MRRGLALGLTAAVAFASASATPAHAQDDRARSMQLFRQSAARYEEGRFDEAAELLREAHRLDPEPLLLYNLGRALEGAGDLPGAADAYDGYLQGSPRARDRRAVAARVETLRRQIAEREQLERARREAEERALAQETAAASAAAPAPSPLDGSPSRGDPADTADGGGGGAGVLPWVTAGAGVAIVGAGVIFALLGQSAHDEAASADVHRDAYDADQRADGWAVFANIGFIAGAVIAAGGVVWALLD